MTQFANWLNTAFADFDHLILEFNHTLAMEAGHILTPIAKIFEFIGEGALLCFVLAAILLLFSKTRMAGMCMAISVGISALITNVTIKNLVARPRPYASGVQEYVEWWEFVGGKGHYEYSFPSGHMTAAVAGMIALCICVCVVNKKGFWVVVPALIYATLMGASRTYLMMHYPTDIIGGLIVGTVGAMLGYLAIKLLYKKVLLRHAENKTCSFILNADIRNLLKKK